VFDEVYLCLSTAKKFGVTDFVNPKDHKRPVQEVWNSPSSSLTEHLSGLIMA